MLQHNQPTALFGERFFMDYIQALQYLNRHGWSQKSAGLDRTKFLLDKLGNPEKRLKFVHVAGSNGKGSTCAMIESILRSEGYKTALMPSPYIEDFRERFQICGQLISGNELAEITSMIQPLADEMEDHPNHFDLITAIGMIYFARHCCDIVILEVGLGGRFDATNVIPSPEVCVICRLGYEHTEYLGNTMKEITYAKCGIIKEGSSVVSCENDPEAMEVIEKACLEKGCSLYISDISRAHIAHSNLDFQMLDIDENKLLPSVKRRIRLNLTGSYQIDNAVLALTVIETLKSRGMNISERAVYEGFSKVKWGSRFEVLSKEPLLILDGAHNPQGVKALCDSLSGFFRGRRLCFILGVLKNKDIEAMLSYLMPFAEKILCVTPDSDRALDKIQLRDSINKLYKKEAPAIAYDNLNMALEEAFSCDLPVICLGSLYLAGEVKASYKKICKNKQRMISLKRRRLLSPDAADKKSLLICEALIKTVDLKGIKTVLSYKAARDEADPSLFDKYLSEKGIKVVYPLSLKDGSMELLYPKDQDSFKKGAFGISEPVREQSEIVDVKDIDLCIVPCVAFDKGLNRLGHGKGYYDRFLPLCKASTETVAAAFSEQELERLITEKNDIKMNMIVTDNAIYGSL